MIQQPHVNTDENIRQGMIAIRGVIRSHVDDYKAMFRADIGNIAFYWGKEGDATSRFLGGYGLSKIIAEKGDDVIADIVRAVARGRIVRRYGASLAPRAAVEYQGQTVVLARIATGRDGLPDTWLLAEWIDLDGAGYQPEPGERPFADVVPGMIAEPEPIDPEPAMTQISEAALSGNWQALKNIFEKAKPEYVPGMFMESAGDSPDLYRKQVIAAFNTYAAPYLEKHYNWSQKDIDDYLNNPENSETAINNMTGDAKDWWKNQGIDPGGITLEDPVTPEKKMLMDEYWPLVSEEYPFAGKTRAEFDETVQWWRDEKIQQAINSRKAKGAKIVDSKAALLAAKSFEDIFSVFKRAFRNVDDERFAKLEESADKVAAAYSLLKSGVTDPESRYFAFKQMDMFGNANALTAAGLDKTVILAEFGEENRNKAKILFDGYSAKGQAVIDELGLNDAIAKQAENAGQITEAESANKQAYDEAKAPYEAREAEASRQYITPLLDEMQRQREDQNDLMRKFTADKPYPSLSSYDLDQDQMVERKQWEKERDQAAYDYNIRTSELAERIREASKAFIAPIQNEKWAVVEEIAKPYTEKLTALNEAKKQLAIDVHAKVINHLLEKSSVTKEQAANWIKQNALMDKKAISKAKKAGYAPEDVQKDLAEFYRITSGRLSRLEYTTIKQSRSAAAHWSGKLYVGSSFGKRTFFHELAHLLEEDPKIVETAREFLAKRRESSTVYSLSSLTGNKAYKRDEGAYKDTWHDAYVGKVYSNATEVVSMGMQMLSSPSLLMALQEKDPEHLAFMLGICSSKPLIDENILQLKQGDIQQKKQVAQKTEDVFKELDKKIAKAGEFWKDHVEGIEPYTRYNRTRPSYYNVTWAGEREGRSRLSSFKSEKIMKRALYLWIANGKPEQGTYSLSELNYTMRNSGALPTELLSGSPVPDIL